MSPSTSRTPKRADAARNIERILDAATVCLADRSTASMADIAKQAGLGRVTLYGHFATRADLVEAVASRLMAENEQALSTVDLTGPPRDALARLIRSTWVHTAQARSIIAAAEDELPPEKMQALHSGPAARIEALIDRGRGDGSFRTDMPTSWLLTVIHEIVHGAAAEVSSGRLDVRDASGLVTTTILAVLDNPR